MTGERELRLMDELVASIKTFQDAVDRFDAAAAASLSINSTDLRCLTALHDRGALTAYQAAKALKITKGATTTALNRLEAAGYVKRNVNSDDGRSFLIELTECGQAAIAEIWTPVRVCGRTIMAQYSVRDLRVLIRFFRQSVDLHERCLETMETEVPAKTSENSSEALNQNVV